MTDTTSKPTTPKSNTPKPNDGLVGVRVLKRGDGRISTGKRKHTRDAFYAKGDTFRMDPVSAEALEERGFLEIED